MRTLISSVLLSLLVPLLLLAVWFYLHDQEDPTTPYIRDPIVVFLKIWELREMLVANSILSLKRLGFGIMAGGVLGVLTGITVGRNRIVRLMIGPILNVLMAIPLIVFIPFFLMVFGLDELFRISVVAALVFLLVHQAMFSVVRSFQFEWLEIAAQREKSEWQISFEMLLPAGLPELIRALRLSLLFGWLALAFSEKAAAQLPYGGLGFQLLQAKEMGRYDEIFAVAITLGSIAWILDFFVGWTHKYIVHWRHTGEGEQ